MKKWLLIIVVIVASILTLGAVTMASPPENECVGWNECPTDTTTTTIYSGAEPASTDENRRVQHEIPTPDLGRCLDGTTEYGFLPCEEETVAVGQPPVPQQPVQMTELPATGAGMRALGVFFVGVALVCFGWLLVKWANDDEDLPRPTTGKSSKTG